MFTTFLPNVPQLFVDVDRDKVLKQGVEISQVYKTLQSFMGGYFVNYFNRFGRPGRSTLKAEGDYRTDANNVVSSMSATRTTIPSRSMLWPTSGAIVGPEFTMRYNAYRCAQINGAAAPGYSSAQAMKALEEVYQQTMPQEMSYDYMGMSFQEKKAAKGVSPLRCLRPVADLCLSYFGRAL